MDASKFWAHERRREKQKAAGEKKLVLSDGGQTFKLPPTSQRRAPFAWAKARARAGRPISGRRSRGDKRRPADRLRSARVRSLEESASERWMTADERRDFDRRSHSTNGDERRRRWRAATATSDDSDERRRRRGLAVVTAASRAPLATFVVSPQATTPVEISLDQTRSFRSASAGL